MWWFWDTLQYNTLDKWLRSQIITHRKKLPLFYCPISGHNSSKCHLLCQANCAIYFCPVARYLILRDFLSQIKEKYLDSCYIYIYWKLWVVWKLSDHLHYQKRKSSIKKPKPQNSVIFEATDWFTIMSKMYFFFSFCWLLLISEQNVTSVSICIASKETPRAITW